MPYYKDLPSVIASSYNEVSGKAAGFGKQIGEKDNKVTFEIEGIRFWNINQDKYHIYENKKYIVKYLPNTQYVVEIKELKD